MNQTGSIYIYNGVSYGGFGLGEAVKGNFPTHWALRVSNSFMCLGSVDATVPMFEDTF